MAELLSPAGDFEKLRAAIRFGADAVYLGGEDFGMRSASANFSREELAAAVEYAHARGVKVYVTVNVLPRTAEYPALRDFLVFLAAAGADGAIISDVGVVALARECAPSLPIHISTQASAVSAAACRAWQSLGASRVVLARELTLDEIREIHRAAPDIELETFIHGSMCVAYSGRCLLSNYFTGRDANHGRCAQPCRWEYHEADVAEIKRPDTPLTVVEEGGDTFVLSSRDLCMIEHIPELLDAGVTSLKIEGRVKSAYYTAVATNAYRMALDAYARGEAYDPAWLTELCSVSHRAYDTGFFFTPPHGNANLVTEPGYIREKAYLAAALTDSDGDGRALFVQRNKLSVGDRLELLTPGRCGIPFLGDEMQSEAGEPITSAPHPMMRFTMRASVPVHAGDIIRAGGED